MEIGKLKDPTVNDVGHLLWGGCDVVRLAEAWGTPLQLLDESAVRARCRAYRQAFSEHYADHRILYAGKAFLTVGMCRIVEQEGLSLDVVSGGELATAAASGFPMDRVWFHGNNKSEAEIALGLRLGIARFVIDSAEEIERVAAEAIRQGKRAAVQIRVTPGIKPSTHSYIQTGQVDSKFGFSIGNGAAAEAVDRIRERPALELRGFHAHIGSQIHEIQAYAAGVRALVTFVEACSQRCGYAPAELNLGGGLGITYTVDDEAPPIDAYVRLLTGTVREAWNGLPAPLPTLMIEPGRSIVGEAGITIYRVGTVKTIPGVRTYVSVDGGMTDNPRAALYQARYHGRLANRMRDAAVGPVSIAGKCCETGDMLAWDLPLPEPRPGDLLAIFSTGAYHYSMSSNYNRLPRPPILLVRGGQSDVLVRAESYDDLLSHDEVPQHLK